MSCRINLKVASMEEENSKDALTTGLDLVRRDRTARSKISQRIYVSHFTSLIHFESFAGFLKFGISIELLFVATNNLRTFVATNSGVEFTTLRKFSQINTLRKSVTYQITVYSDRHQ